MVSHKKSKAIMPATDREQKSKRPYVFIADLNEITSTAGLFTRPIGDEVVTLPGTGDFKPRRDRLLALVAVFHGGCNWCKRGERGLD
jgi:hypothetical protein